MQESKELKSYRVLLKERRSQGFSEQELVGILQQVLQQLSDLHTRGIVHGSISPDAFVVEEETSRIFLSQSTGSDSSTFSAPEVLASGAPSFVGDIYSLGLSAIVLLTNQSPAYFQNEAGDLNWEAYHLVINERVAINDAKDASNWKAYRSFSNQLTAIFKKATVFDPRYRYQNAVEMLQDIITRMANADEVKTQVFSTSKVIDVESNPISNSPISDSKRTLIGALTVTSTALLLGSLYSYRMLSKPPLAEEPPPIDVENVVSQLDLTQQQAISLVEDWLASKAKIFAPPYDKHIAADIAVGEYYENILYTVDWLEQNDAYFEYHSQELERVIDFSVDKEQASIQVIVQEVITLYEGGEIIDSRSGLKRTNVVYILNYVDGRWKIASDDIIE